MTQNLVAENARVAQDQNEYQKRYDGLVQRYETAKKSYDDLVAKIEQKEAHGERMLAPGTHSHFESGKFSQFWPEPGTNPAQWVRLKTPFRVHPKQPN